MERAGWSDCDATGLLETELEGSELRRRAEEGVGAQQRELLDADRLLDPRRGAPLRLRRVEGDEQVGVAVDRDQHDLEAGDRVAHLAVAAAAAARATNGVSDGVAAWGCCALRAVVPLEQRAPPPLPRPAATLLQVRRTSNL
eukprot:4379925-Prymnesium_polylepis.1